MLRKFLGFVSVFISAWLIYEVVTQARYFQSGILLAYVGFVVWFLLQTESAPTVPESLSLEEDKILKLIRQKQQAKRSDILPHIEVSKSTLVRILDKLEEKKLIRQIGDRKASYYVLAKEEAE